MYKETQREPGITRFEIYIYDKSTRQYSNSAVGNASGRDSHEACERFVSETGWEPESENKMLYAKHPICR